MSFIAMTLVFAATMQDTEAPVINAGNSELQQYLLEAGENHPGLQERYTSWRAALEEIPQAKSLEDPMFTYGQFLRSEINRVKFTFAQKFPWFGTLRLRGDAAAAAADAELAKFYGARNEIFAQVKRAYFEYGFLAESIRITESQLHLLEYMEEVVRSNYQYGLASEHDLRRIQIEQTEVKDRVDGFLDLRPALSASLSEKLGRENGKLLPWPEETALPEAHPGKERIYRDIRESNPDLDALDRIIESQEKQVELAKKKKFPDITLGMDYTSVSIPRQIRPDRPYPSSIMGAKRLLNGSSSGAVGTFTDLYSVANYDEPMSYRSGGEDNFMVSFKISVPIWRKRIKAGISEAELRKRSTEHQKLKRTLSLDSAADMAVFRMDDSLRRHKLFESNLVPQAQASYEGLLAAYSSGGTDADFLDVLESVRLLLNFGLEQVRAARDLQIAAADLEFLLGKPWAESPVAAVVEEK